MSKDNVITSRTNKYNTAITILAFSSLACYLLSFADNIFWRLFDYISEEFEWSVTLPSFWNWADMILKIAPCILVLLWFFNVVKKTKPNRFLSVIIVILSLDALREIVYNCIGLIENIHYILYEPEYLESTMFIVTTNLIYIVRSLVMVTLFVVIVVIISKGLSKKKTLKVCAFIIMLIEVCIGFFGVVVAISFYRNYYLIANSLLTSSCAIFYSLGQLPIYAAIYLFYLSKIAPLLETKLYQALKEKIKNLDAEQALMLLDKSLACEEISKEGYQALRVDVIERL